MDISVNYCVLIQKLEEQAKQICEMATSGPFLDPNEPSSPILKDINKVNMFCRIGAWQKTFQLLTQKVAS